MANKYEYQPLPDEESIRVLVLSPGEGDEPLSGVLKMNRLSNRRQTLRSAQRRHKRRKTSPESEVTRWTPEIPYEAISYVWGSYEKNDTILLSGKIHQITANLRDALHQCRLPDQPRVLWADSICIDQDMLKEKNHQVYMMGRIYASSQRTLICLGTDPDNRDHARGALGVIFDANKMIQDEFQKPDFSWEADSFPWPPSDDPLVNDSRWQSVAILFKNPWFSRGWVVQEAALGREASLLWAGYEIALLELLRVRMWYVTRGSIPAVDEPDLMSMARNPLLSHMYYHERKAEARVFSTSDSLIKDLDILKALDISRGLELSDPRDRIYAFLELPYTSNPMPALRPDYKQPHLELYQQFAKKYLEETSDLNLLLYVAHWETNKESHDDTLRSSWVPRWDRPSGRVNQLYGKPFGKTSTKPVEFVILDRENDTSASLQVRAIIFDSVKLLSRQFHKTMTIDDLITFWSHWSKEVGPATTSRKHESTSEYDSLEFLGAMCFGWWSGASQEAWVDMLKSYSKILQNSTTGSGSPVSSQIPPSVQSGHYYVVQLARQTRIFLLGGGHYGSGPWTMKEDDVCALIFGVCEPLILRKVSEAGAHHYKVIGPAFVASRQLHPELGIPFGLNQWDVWDNWDDLCDFEELTDWGLQEEQIILL